MLVSELLKLRNGLQKAIDFTRFDSELDAMCAAVETLQDGNPDYVSDLTSLLSSVKKVSTATKKPLQELEIVVDKINQEISDLSQTRFINNYSLPMIDHNENYARNKLLVVPPDIKDTIIGRISLYADWHYPGMEIGPRQGEFTNHLVGCEPLYLVDVYHETLEAVPTQFSPEYQARLRTYQVGHWCNEKGLTELPQHQFGFVFSWNFFNYLPIDEIKKYLFDIYGVMRPGGTFMFSYNNGETVMGTTHAEWGGMAYTPKTLLALICEGHGFEFIAAYDFETDISNISWLEIKKPGTLATTKAHQTLGSVKNISE